MKLRSIRCLVMICVALTLGGASAAEPDSANRANTQPKKRSFRFVYGATITGLEPGAQARLWLPLATNSHWQKVRRTTTQVPGEPRETLERRFGNALLYTEASADARGEIPLRIVYEIERAEFLPGEDAPNVEKNGAFLQGSQKVPVDGTLRQRLLAKTTLPRETIAVGRALYDVVNRQMRYDKPEGKPWGRGDALWACGSGFGNCTDFHSVFIGLCRDLRIPAKFEIGFPIPNDASRGEIDGYHCWAMFADGDRWVAVDISEADKHPEMTDYYFGRLTPDRVGFTTGRDLQLDPPQQASPVNFLVYPYVEVDGKQHTEFKKQFRFEDLKHEPRTQSDSDSQQEVYE